MKDDQEFPVPISELDPDLRARCACSDATILNWIMRYMVGGEPLGIKVGGQWRLFPSRLEAFLLGKGTPKYKKKKPKEDDTGTEGCPKCNKDKGQVLLV